MRAPAGSRVPCVSARGAASPADQLAPPDTNSTSSAQSEPSRAQPASAHSMPAAKSSRLSPSLFMFRSPVPAVPSRQTRRPLIVTAGIAPHLNSLKLNTESCDDARALRKTAVSPAPARPRLWQKSNRCSLLAAETKNVTCVTPLSETFTRISPANSSTGPCRQRIVRGPWFYLCMMRGDFAWRGMQNS